MCSRRGSASRLASPPRCRTACSHQQPPLRLACARTGQPRSSDGTAHTAFVRACLGRLFASDCCRRLESMAVRSCRDPETACGERTGKLPQALTASSAAQLATPRAKLHDAVHPCPRRAVRCACS
eukprot:3938825-Rhodomonas_salina.1